MQDIFQAEATKSGEWLDGDAGRQGLVKVRESQAKASWIGDW